MRGWHDLSVAARRMGSLAVNTAIIRIAARAGLLAIVQMLKVWRNTISYEHGAIEISWHELTNHS